MDFDEKDNSFAWTEIFYTRHAEKVHLVRESDKIEIQNCIFFEQIRQVAGLADFDCYYYENRELDERYYSFVPKCLSYLAEREL